MVLIGERERVTGPPGATGGGSGELAGLVPGKRRRCRHCHAILHIGLTRIQPRIEVIQLHRGLRSGAWQARRVDAQALGSKEGAVQHPRSQAEGSPQLHKHGTAVAHLQASSPEV